MFHKTLALRLAAHYTIDAWKTIESKGDKQSMEEKSFTKKPFAKKPYRVDAKALESKGFEMIRYDRHESYAKTYRIEGRAFIGTVNPVTGDRTISKAGPFASVKDMECLRAAWDQLSEDVLGPRPTAFDPQDAAVMENHTVTPAVLTAPAPGDGALAINDGKLYDVHDLTGNVDAITCPHCGKSHFRVDGVTTTAVSMPTIVRDGHIVPQPDVNKTRTRCTCLECGEQFETAQDPLSPTPAAQEAR